VNLGVILPSFSTSARDALDAADAAERVGLHGVFVFDHLWPVGEPGRPALSPFPLLGAISARTHSIAIGTLVARIGLVEDTVLVSEFLTLNALSSGRVIAGVGVGDERSAAENIAFGVGFLAASERRNSLEKVILELRREGVATWVGGGTQATNALARRNGAVLNLWGAEPDAMARAGREGPVTWAGALPKDAKHAAERLDLLQRAGATWAVALWQGSVDGLVHSARQADINLAS
jgi:alkanesulfonate monooxygenase SsuD/methylene tetrahydromethanopterin reductase-like flavin-dependent oxidoreductase (luciferase family)